jgi:TM2 domain-containing membrane protein YozV
MISKPPHNRYLLATCDDSQYCKLVSRYQKAKKYGIRAVVGYLSGAEIYQIVGEIGKGALRTWGRQKAASVATIVIAWLGGPVAIGFTNATKVVRIAKGVHTAASFILELGEDSANLSYLPLDLIFFGQPIAVDVRNRFNVLINVPDFFE